MNQGSIYFPKIYEPLQNSRWQNIRQLPYWEGTTIQNLIAAATRHPGFVYSWHEPSSTSKYVEIFTNPSKLVIHWGLSSSGIWQYITRCLVPSIFTQGSVLIIKGWNVRECQTFQPVNFYPVSKRWAPTAQWCSIRSHKNGDLKYTSATLNSCIVIVPS